MNELLGKDISGGGILKCGKGIGLHCREKENLPTIISAKGNERSARPTPRQSQQQHVGKKGRGGKRMKTETWGGKIGKRTKCGEKSVTFLKRTPNRQRKGNR